LQIAQNQLPESDDKITSGWRLLGLPGLPYLLASAIAFNGGGIPVLGLLLIFVVILLGSAVLLWGGTYILQAYIYSNPTPDLFWRAPLAAAITTLFLAFWISFDYRRPGSFNTLFDFSAVDDQAYDKFLSVKNKKEIPYAAHKIGKARIEYRDSQGKAWTRSDTEGAVSAIIVEEPDGRKTRFEADMTKEGTFTAKQGEPVRYREEGGKRVMTDSFMGRVTVTRWGLVFGNILLNFGLLVAWFIVLWLLLRFQWPHAFGLALAVWAAFIFVLPALFRKAEDVSKSRAAQTASSASLRTGQNVHDVAILHDIGLPFEPVNALSLGLFHRTDAAEIVVTDNLRANEAAGDIGMDLRGPFDGVFTFLEAPGSALVFAYGKEDHQPHRAINLP
jgi:hypothetical protein